MNIAATHGKLMFASGPITNIGYQGNLKCSDSLYLIASARWTRKPSIITITISKSGNHFSTEVDNNHF